MKWSKKIMKSIRNARHQPDTEYTDFYTSSWLSTIYISVNRWDLFLKLSWRIFLSWCQKLTKSIQTFPSPHIHHIHSRPSSLCITLTQMRLKIFCISKFNWISAKFNANAIFMVVGCLILKIENNSKYIRQSMIYAM